VATPADGGDTTVEDTTVETPVETESGASKITVFTGFFAAFVTLFF